MFNNAPTHQPGTVMNYESINFQRKFSLFTEQWKPKVIAEMNDYQFKVARLEGDFMWHAHNETDEAFIVIEGELRIDFRDGSVSVRTGDMFVVPKGVEHKPFAEGEVKLLLIEPRGVRNTGDEINSRTAENDVRI
jgi:mannose-6-phosphate isomerase-like protein (cupin superfamily)